MNPEIIRLLKNIKDLVHLEEGDIVVYAIKNTSDWIFNYRASDNTYQLYGSVDILSEEQFVDYLNKHILN